MTNPNKAAIMLVVDRSGSMHSLRESAQASINKFIADLQLNDGTQRTIAIAHFDDRYELVTPSMPVKECPAFKLEPRGWTALLDAMGKAITDLGAELAALPEDERPGTVILGILTDGIENSSKKYSWDQISTMVRHQEDVYNWQIAYLAADQDAIATGAKVGVREWRSVSWNTTDESATATMDWYSGAVYAASSAGGAPIVVTDKDREKVLAEDID